MRKGLALKNTNGETDHFCKPDLTIISQTDPSFIAWYAHFLDSNE